MVRLSVVTPSLNQAPFLRQALESIHTQGYPHLEHWVIDGGSTDRSIEILEDYAGRGLLRFVSEKDSGQSNAINKGLRQLTGDVVCWLNSDDMYAPGTLPFVADYFSKHSDVHVLTGDCLFVDAEGRVTGEGAGSPVEWEQLLRLARTLWQPSTFFRRRLLETTGLLDERLHYCMDHDLWLRMGRIALIHYVPRVFSYFRYHPQSKSSGRFQDSFLPELVRSSRRYWGTPLSPAYWRRFRAVAAYAAQLYYGAAVESRGEGDDRAFRRYLRLATKCQPWHLLYWKDWLGAGPRGSEGPR